MFQINYSKYNKVIFKSPKDKRDAIRIFDRFFQDLPHQKEGKEMKGHIILESINDPQEAIVLTFWETKDAMDWFYSPDNSALSGLVERVKPYFAKMPERSDYGVSRLSF